MVCLCACPGEELDYRHSLWTSLLASLSRANVGYGGTSPCLELSETRPLPLSGKIQFQTSLTHFEDGYGFRAPTQRRPTLRFLAAPRGFISSLPSTLFLPTILLCPPFFPPFHVGLPPHSLFPSSSPFLQIIDHDSPWADLFLGLDRGPETYPIPLAQVADKA